MEPKHLLVVDDDEMVCLVLSSMLQEFGYEVVTETDARRVMSILRGGDFDVVLLDLVMPGMNGMELLAQIREHFSVLPVLVVTGYGGVESTVEAMRSGATDFITKPVEAALLDIRIRRAFDLEQARRLASTDGLTGLYNHRTFQERLDQELERVQRYERPLSLLMADLDNFKDFNDSYGHPRGDEVLIAVAHVLRKVSRASDFVARYGGEEFALILPETPRAAAEVLANRARQCVEELRFEWEEAAVLTRLTISFGVASAGAGTSKEALLKAADAALYQAKRQGRNRVCQAPRADDDIMIDEEPELSVS